MKRTHAPFLAILAATVVSALSAPKADQEIFDLLRQGDLAQVKARLEASPALVEARDGSGNTLLHHAAAGGDAGFVGYLLDRGAKVDAVGAMSGTPLHVAARDDREAVVAVLLKRGAALEAKDDYGRTPLVLCARERGQLPTTRILVEAGANIDALDRFESSALELAAWRGKREVVGFLLARGAKVPESGRKWGLMLFESTSQGLEELFQRLTRTTEDLRTVEAQGPWLLQSAAAGGSAEIVALLLKKGFDPARPGRFGWTPLHYAALNGRTDVARVLVEAGAPLDARTAMGETAYNVARDRQMDAVAALLAGKGADRSALRFPALEGDYLGQPPPGREPQLFAPGIVSSVWGLHSTAVFSPAGDEVYWAPMIEVPGEIYTRNGLLVMRRVDGRWTAPTWASFSGPRVGDDVPFFSADGQRIYFLSRRPVPGEKEAGRETIWFADRSPSGWSEPRPLDPVLEEIDKHWQFSLDRQGNLVFAGRAADSLGQQDLYLARLVNGRYERPANLGEPVNSAAGEDTPFLAPDGSYLLFSRDYDLWASFREGDGRWSAPLRFGPGINSPAVELCPIVTADGKYLFFLSHRDGESHAYWVSAAVVEELRPGRSAAGAAPAEERSPDHDVVKAAIEQKIGWAIEKDFDELFALWGDDLFHFWLFSDSTIVGLDAFKKRAEQWRDPDFRGTRFEFRDLRIVFSRSGDVAWYSTTLDDCGTFKGKEFCLKDVFQTGVLEKRDGRWVHVLVHSSYPVDKVPEGYVRRFYSGLFEKPAGK